MLGKVFELGESKNSGLILGEDGRYYSFTAKDLESSSFLYDNVPVYFEVGGKSIDGPGVAYAVKIHSCFERMSFDEFQKFKAEQKTWRFRWIGYLLKNLFNFRGRSGRKELVVALSILAAICLMGILIDAVLTSPVEILSNVMIGLKALVLYMVFGVVVRRLHDIGYTAWYVILVAVALFLPLVALVIMPSKKFTNRWGYPSE